MVEEVEPLVGIEPTTYSLRMNCSTPELQRPWKGFTSRGCLPIW